MTQSLAISFLTVSLIDALCIELYLKRRWRIEGWENWKKTFRIYQVVLFASWYLVAYKLTNLETVAIQAALHVAGWEDLFYALWTGPIVALWNRYSRSVLIPYLQPVFRLWIWEFPKEWSWLGKHSPGTLGIFSTNWWLVLVAGEKIRFYQLVASCVLIAGLAIGFIR